MACIISAEEEAVRKIRVSSTVISKILLFRTWPYWALGFTQPLAEMSTGNIKSDNVSGE
jgi:hypothetical protein